MTHHAITIRLICFSGKIQETPPTCRRRSSRLKGSRQYGRQIESPEDAKKPTPEAVKPKDPISDRAQMKTG
jgi:hypothetical protein